MSVEGSPISTVAEPTVHAETVRMFADPLRLRIIELLATEELCTCHLVGETGAKQPTVSHHLRLLKQAGLVDAEPVGAYTYYRLVPDAVLALSRGLDVLGQQAATVRRRRLGCE